MVDRLADQLIPVARFQRDDALAFLRNPALFGGLAEDQRFSEPTGRRSNGSGRSALTRRSANCRELAADVRRRQLDVLTRLVPRR